LSKNVLPKVNTYSVVTKSQSYGSAMEYGSNGVYFVQHKLGAILNYLLVKALIWTIQLRLTYSTRGSINCRECNQEGKTEKIRLDGIAYLFVELVELGRSALHYPSSSKYAVIHPVTQTKCSLRIVKAEHILKIV
jgi:hypothetical protein